ncbi:glucose-1-phosphate cytidylyltransferase [bacterium]|nr:glucose-1-phosphate cytidylyltransferase [bacterium]
MKVVLFCGGLGTRLRDYGDNVPKPLVPIGYRPVLWHVMKYYAHFGHKDFILCLGYKADRIKDYFLNYDECISNDFTLTSGGKKIELKQSDIEDWSITFVDTGLTANIGSRLRQVASYLEGEEYFLANYTDGLTNYPLPQMIDEFKESGKVGAFLCAPPSQTFHVVKLDDHHKVVDLQYVRDTDILVNCGYFVFHRRIFDFLKPGEELVSGPFRRLIDQGQLLGFPCEKFFAMDTFKEQQELTDLFERGEAPWVVWKNGPENVEISPHAFV